MSRLHFTYNYADHTYAACDANSADTSADSITPQLYQGTLDDFQEFKITKDGRPVKENIASTLRTKIQQTLLSTSFKKLSEPSAVLLRRPDYASMESLDVAIENLISSATKFYPDCHFADALQAELRNQKITRKLAPLVSLFYQMSTVTWEKSNLDDLFRLLDFITYVRLMKKNGGTPATITFIGDAKLKEQLKTLVDCLPDLNITIKYKSPGNAKERTIYSLTQRLDSARDDTFETAGMTRKERWLYSYLGIPRPNSNQSSFITGLQWTAYFLGGFILSPAKSFLRLAELFLYYVETHAAHWYLNNRHDATKKNSLVSANAVAKIFKALRATVRACLSPIKSYRHAAGMKADTTKDKWLRAAACTASVLVSSGFVGALIFIVGPLLATHLLPKLGLNLALHFSAASITTGAITTTEAIYSGATLGVVALQTMTEAITPENLDSKPITPSTTAAPTRASTPLASPQKAPAKGGDTLSITSRTSVKKADSGTGASSDLTSPERSATAPTAETVESIAAKLAEHLASRTDEKRDAASMKAASTGGGLHAPPLADKLATPLTNEGRSVSPTSSQ